MISQQVAHDRVGNPVLTHHFPHTLMNRRLSRLQIRVTQSPRTRTELTAVLPVQVPSFVIRETRLHNQRFHQNFLVSFCLQAQMASYTCRRTLQTGAEPFSAYIKTCTEVQLCYLCSSIDMIRSADGKDMGGD